MGINGNETGDLQTPNVLPPPSRRKVSRRRALWTGVAALGTLAACALGYEFGKRTASPIAQESPTPLPLGVSGEFVGLTPGQTVSGDTFYFTIDEQLAPNNQITKLAATIWYKGAIPDTTTNPKGGWVNADVEQVNITESGQQQMHINMQQPKPHEPPVPDGEFSLSVNVSGIRPDGKIGITEGVPGPIQLVYQRRG